MHYIRKATRDDIERIRSIVEQCWNQASDDFDYRKKIVLMIHDLYSYAKLTDAINDDVSTFLLAIDGELAVAFASYQFDNSDVLSCELKALYCLPQTQGKRLDEMLVNEVIKNTIAAGGNKIFAVLTNYTGSIGLFSRLGFELVRANASTKLNTEILIMHKNLAISAS